MAPSWKGGEGKPSVGSNPTSSSNIGVSSNGRIAVSKIVNGGSSPSALASPQYLDDILVLGRAQSGLFVTSQLEECNGIIL